MDRRLFLAATLGALAAPGALAQTASITRWKVTSSEGHDAIAFLGPLSGEPLYQNYYAEDAKAFPLPDPVRAEIAALWKEAGTAGFGLLGPVLSSKISGTDVSTLDAVITALADPEARIRPSLQKSPYWDEAEWKWLAATAPASSRCSRRCAPPASLPSAMRARRSSPRAFPSSSAISRPST
ncbi:hypothetical protein PIB19_18450 [Sphingomonas sp. 7/4-4]|uniref:hypothetical protein n=1 Tax=Sphingomonas sp. 7/4-4 TaxID=3018446 RepID=UPI0022F3E448|nr:hypothetical protein [Sphingomonas sp. 7/4-4]WBY07327.1 hypothetical protein PIB19_18450 [Sphingomonas sp. 7/4-4]